MIEEMLRADAMGMQVKEELRNDSDATETEGDATELTKRVVSTCNKRWAEEFLQTRLTPEQERDEKHKLTYDDDGNVTLTGPQRSFVQAMLRKHMASKFLAYAIWQIGLPAFLKEDPQEDDPENTEQLLQSSALDISQWLHRLGTSIHAHREQEGCEEQRRRSGTSHQQSGLSAADLDRKQELQRLKSATAQGKRLRQEMDDEKSSGKT